MPSIYPTRRSAHSRRRACHKHRSVACAITRHHLCRASVGQVAPIPATNSPVDPTRKGQLNHGSKFSKNLRRLHLWSIELSGTAIAAQLYAMSGYSQQDLPASRPFDFGRAGHDYFADEQHYGSVAGRVIGELRQGGRIALVTGDPPINPLSLATALIEATSGKHTVLAIACGDDFTEEPLCRPAGPSPIFLFDQADRLSDGQLSELCSYLASGGNRPAGVLLGRAGFGTRLGKLQPSLFEEGRAVRFNFYELGRDEIDGFIRRELCPSKAAQTFSVDEINWIADFSSGNPARVTQLSRLILELGSSVGDPGKRSDSTSQRTPPSSAPRWRRSMKRPALIGVLLCLGMGLIVITVDRHEFGAMIGAPTGSRGNGSLPPEQTAASPPATVAAQPSTETAALPAEPVAHHPWPRPRRRQNRPSPKPIF